MSSSKLCSHFAVVCTTIPSRLRRRKWSAGLFNHFSPDSSLVVSHGTLWLGTKLEKIQMNQRLSLFLLENSWIFVVCFALLCMQKPQKSKKNRLKNGWRAEGSTSVIHEVKLGGSLKAEVRHTIHQKTRPLSQLSRIYPLVKNRKSK